MSSREKQDARQYSALQIRLYLASVVMLVVGLIGDTIDHRYILELQRIGGTAEVVMAELHQWFDSLWHGKPLACTVAVLCTALAAGCFWAAHTRIFEPAHEQTD